MRKYRRKRGKKGRREGEREGGWEGGEYPPTSCKQTMSALYDKSSFTVRRVRYSE